MPVFVTSLFLFRFLESEYRFEWDEGNESKSFLKHGRTAEEIEECFLDSKLYIVGVCVKPTFNEARFAVIGATHQGTLFIVFTIRGKNIRVISARKANKYERSKYEQE